MSPLENVWAKNNCHENQISSRQTCFYAKLTTMDTAILTLPTTCYIAADIFLVIKRSTKLAAMEDSI